MFTLDLSGLKCPLPALKARKRLFSLEIGQQLEVITTDPMAAIDIPHLVNETGQKLVASRSTPTGHIFILERLT